MYALLARPTGAAERIPVSYRRADGVVAARMQRRRSAVSDVVTRCRQDFVVRLQQPIADHTFGGYHYAQHLTVLGFAITISILTHLLLNFCTTSSNHQI